MTRSSSYELVVLGGGPGGYAAAFYAADLGMRVGLIDREENPGGVCLYRGCIPSKALLHVARVMHEVAEAEQMGVSFGRPSVDVERLRAWKQSVVARQTSGLGQLMKARKITHAVEFLESAVERAHGGIRRPHRDAGGFTPRAMRDFRHGRDARADALAPLAPIRVIGLQRGRNEHPG